MLAGAQKSLLTWNSGFSAAMSSPTATKFITALSTSCTNLWGLPNCLRWRTNCLASSCFKAAGSNSVNEVTWMENSYKILKAIQFRACGMLTHLVDQGGHCIFYRLESELHVSFFQSLGQIFLDRFLQGICCR